MDRKKVLIDTKAREDIGSMIRTMRDLFEDYEQQKSRVIEWHWFLMHLVDVKRISPFDIKTAYERNLIGLAERNNFLDKLERK